jgi:hypothetical protein
MHAQWNDARAGGASFAGTGEPGTGGSGACSTGSSTAVKQETTVYRSQVARSFGVGLLVGMGATCFNAPFDVVKSRFQVRAGPPPLSALATTSTRLLATTRGNACRMKHLWGLETHQTAR